MPEPPPPFSPADSIPRAKDCCMKEFPLDPERASAFLTSLNKFLVSSSYSIATIATLIISSPRSTLQP